MISYPLATRFSDYGRLMRFDRPIGILLLLWPTLWGLWFAAVGRPEPRIVVIFVLGVVVMRALGCVANDIADRHIDPYVARTKNRPLAAGRITLLEAVIVLLLLACLALFLVLLTNILTIALACLGFILAMIYPLMKRITALPQLVLGVAFAAWPILMAFAAVQNHLPPLAWLLALAALFWPLIYDTMYALVDQEDDKKISVNSTALLFGRATSIWIAIFQLILFSLLGLTAKLAGLHWPFYLGLFVAALLALYEQYLIKDHQRDRCFRAFCHNRWIGLAIFVGLFVSYLC
ncbi:MAG: 4-hydroxybenzoate octaprenyltransferase [Gammaproteobacteria bacterium]|nr:4-hydroxybenzoate octaprenyltransferase [Gammaproteobacteria bacterium]MCP4476226.1 4-hydroxybenzoate octaprenyltransferase [Gammaproteobacteria bacterium]